MYKRPRLEMIGVSRGVNKRESGPNFNMPHNLWCGAPPPHRRSKPTYMYVQCSWCCCFSMHRRSGIMSMIRIGIATRPERTEQPTKKMAFNLNCIEMKCSQQFVHQTDQTIRKRGGGLAVTILQGLLAHLSLDFPYAHSMQTVCSQTMSQPGHNLVTRHNLLTWSQPGNLVKTW